MPRKTRDCSVAHALASYVTQLIEIAQLRPEKLFAAALLFGLGALAHTQAQSQNTTDLSELPTITSFSEYWEAVQAERQKDRPHRIEIEFNALYYDPEWTNLWATQSGIGGYMPVSRSPMPFRSGDRVAISGTIVPSKGLDSETVTIELLEENAFPPPEPLAEDLSDYLKRHLSYVSVEGFVDRLIFQDNTHCGYDLIVGGRRIAFYLLFDRGEPLPQIEGRFVRVEALLDVTPRQGKQPDVLTIWTEGSSKVTPAAKLATHRFESSPTKISDLAQAAPGRPAVVSGVVYSQDPGKLLIVRDETGQIQLATEQASALPRGTPLEISGYPKKIGASWTLDRAVYRTIDAATSQEQQQAYEGILKQYRLIEQALRLPLEEQDLGHSAQFSGVVTFVDPDNQFFYLQDPTGGIRVEPIQPLAQPPLVGDAVEAAGKLSSGGFAPLLKARTVTIEGTLPLPPPSETSYEEAMSGRFDSQWVEMAGYVETSENDGKWTHLTLSTPQGNFEAEILNTEESAVAYELGSTLRLRGVLVTKANERKQLQAVLFVVPKKSFAKVEAPALENPFSLPLSDIASLEHYEPFSVDLKYRRLRGVVTYQKPGKSLFISDGVDALRVLSHSAAELEPNDLVEVVGLAQRNSRGVLLRNAQLRRIGLAEPLHPVDLDPSQSSPHQPLDGHLVSFTGSLLDTSVSGNEIRLYLSQNGRTQVAVGSNSYFDGALPELRNGASLSVTGVYDLTFDEHGEPDEANILLRRPSDIIIVQPAPWWTPQRAVYVLLLCGIAIFFGSLWALALQRRVAHQNRLLRQKIERETMLERQHREIVRNASDFIYTTDIEGRFITFNKAAKSITGYNDDEIRSLSIFDLLDYKRKGQLRVVMNEQSESHNTVFETKLRRKDGSLIWVEVSTGFLAGESGKPCAFGVMRDIHGRKQVEKALQKAKEAAEENTKAKSAFLATMSHELRTPMNGIIGMTDLLLDLNLDSEAREFGETIRECSLSLLVLLNDILDLSKAEAGKLVIDPRPFDLRNTLQQSIALLETTAQSKNLELHCKLPDKIPQKLVGDAGRLRQVLLNLVGNAIKFTEKGHVKLSAELESETDDSATYRLEILDTGIGIPEKAQAQLFQPFFQADASYSRRFGGSGLGLKISQEIVSLMGGKIGMESKEGKGSKFWFSAKFGKTDDDETGFIQTKGSTRSKKKQNSSWSGPPLRILVAEDTPVNQRVTRLQLSRMGLDSDLAANGVEVLEAVKRKRYDVIFMDCQMPQMDGFEATRILRESPRNESIYIVALTANAMAGDRERCLDAGMNDYVSKPTRPDKLLAALETFANQQHR